MPSFRELHQPGNPFILANAWDRGSARVLAGLGVKALATTSAGHAFTLGRPDLGHVTREEAIAHAAELVEATPLPVSGDLENGYGHDSDAVVETINASAKAGLAGCCIEDTHLPGVEAYPFALAVERIEAAASACRALDGDFVLAARADGVMHRQYDMAEAMRRIKAYEKVGADVLYIPVLPDIDALAEVCRSIEVPVNVLCAGAFTQYSFSELASAGAARISLGSSLAAITQKAMLDAATAMLDEGDFTLLRHTAKGGVIDRLMEKGG